MSADNGIYIAKFTDGYRVVHAQAIDNCFWEGYSEEEKHAERILYFAASQNYSSLEEAYEQAIVLAQSIGYTEYGICELTFNHPFFDKVNSVEEANEIIGYYWDIKSKREIVRED